MTSTQAKSIIAAAGLAVLTGCGGGAKSSTLGSGFAGLSESRAARQFERADKALFDDPYDAKALLDRAEAHAALGNGEAAMNDAMTALATGERAGNAQKLVDQLEQAGVAVPVSIAVIAAAEDDAPESAQNPALAEEDASETSDTEATETETADSEPADAETPDIAAMLKQADDQIASGDRTGALVTLTEAISLDESSADAFRKRGWLHIGDGYLDAAFDDLDRSIALDPGSAPSHELRGYASLRAEEFAQAAGFLTRAIELDTATPNRLLYRGVALANLDDASSVEDLELSLAMAGSSWQYREYAERWLERARAIAGD